MLGCGFFLGGDEFKIEIHIWPLENHIWLFCKFIFGPFEVIFGLFIGLILCVLNFHHIVFLSLTDRLENDSAYDYKTVIFNSSSYPNDSMLYNFVDDYVEKQIEITQKCFAQSGSLYEKFLLNTWFWLDLSAYSLIPATGMIICSIIIMLRMKKINKSGPLANNGP